MPYLNKEALDPEPVDCRILSAALELFVEHGFHSVSVHDIQKNANVSIGSIYNHYNGKEGVAKKLYQHLLQEFEDMIQDVINKEQSSIDCCDEIIRLLFVYTESKRSLIEYTFYSKHQEFLLDKSHICDSVLFNSLAKIVQIGIDAGEIRASNPLIISTNIFGSAIRMIQLRLDGIITEPLITLYDEFIDCVWQGVKS